jgi:hypothetical protein
MKRFFLIAGISLVLLLLVGGGLAVFGTYSNGSRVGKIIKFSQKGLVFKTYEGQLSLGAVSTGDEGELTEKWAFSVYRGDEPVVNQINQAMDEGYRVRLYYKEKFFQFDWRGDTKNLIERVEPLREGEQR